jgi:DNA-binding transcriptional regulator LsrR (DeoR family)
MSELSKQQKKELAKTLFLTGKFTQKEISEKTGVSRQSLSKWVNDGKWEELLVGVTISRENILQGLQRQINEINKAILNREDGARFATPSETVTIGKLSEAIKKLEIDLGISEIVSVSIAINEFIKKFDVEKAKEVSEYFDAFVEEKMRK